MLRERNRERCVCSPSQTKYCPKRGKDSIAGRHLEIPPETLALTQLLSTVVVCAGKLENCLG